MGRNDVGEWLDRVFNPTLSSFSWRKYIFEQFLPGGRSVKLIVRNGAGVVTDLVPLDTANLHVYETNERFCWAWLSRKNGCLFCIPTAVLQEPFHSGAAAQCASKDVAQATARLVQGIRKRENGSCCGACA